MTHRHCEENVPTRRWICRKFDEMQCMSGCVDGKRGFGVDCLEHGHVQTRAAAGLAGGTTQVQCLELQHNTSEADTALRSIPPRHPFL